MHFEKKLKKSKTTLQFGSMLPGAWFDSAEANDMLPAASRTIAFGNVDEGPMTDNTSYLSRKALPKKG
ncbi:MAG: hypothetical protein ACREX0_13255 [Noviherbaspirillum sp.]